MPAIDDILEACRGLTSEILAAEEKLADVRELARDPSPDTPNRVSRLVQDRKIDLQELPNLKRSLETMWIPLKQALVEQLSVPSPKKTRKGP